MRRAALLLALTGCQQIHELAIDAGSPADGGFVADAGPTADAGVGSCPYPTIPFFETFDGGFNNPNWLVSNNPFVIFQQDDVQIYGVIDAGSSVRITYLFNAPVDLRGISMSVKINDVPFFRTGGGDNGLFTFFEIGAEQADGGLLLLRIAYNGGTLYAYDDGGQVGTAPSLSRPMYWRFRESAGAVSFESTADSFGAWASIGTVQVDASRIATIALGLDSLGGDAYPATFADLDVCP